MKFVITINCDGAAFRHPDDDAEEYNHEATRDLELARILRSIAGSLEQSEISTGTLFDTNGNRCGYYGFTD